MAFVYIVPTASTPVDIFAGFPAATVNDTQVTAEILATWSDAEIAALGLARATIVIPAFDPNTTDLTGGYQAVKVNGAWQWVAQTVPLTPSQIAVLLASAKATQIQTLGVSYAAACAAPVGYMGTTFAADPASIKTLNNTLTALGNDQPPAGFYWLDVNNAQIVMNLAQLQGLATVMIGQGWPAFQHLQTLKAQVAAATTIPAVQAITW